MLVPEQVQEAHVERQEDAVQYEKTPDVGSQAPRHVVQLGITCVRGLLHQHSHVFKKPQMVWETSFTQIEKAETHIS